MPAQEFETSAQSGPEQLPRFVATPERVSPYVELKEEEVAAELQSVEGRERVFQQLMEHEEELRNQHPEFHPEELRAQLDAAGEALKAQERFLAQTKSPEKKTLFRRVWDTVKSFPVKHPFITLFLVTALLTAVGINMGWLPKISIPGLGGSGWGIFGGGGEAAAEAAGEVAASGAVEAAAEVAGETAAIGTEVAADMIPEALRIKIFEHNFLYNNQIYNMEQLPELIEQLPSLEGDQALRIMRYANARVTPEIEIINALKGMNIPYEFIDTLGDVNFVPTNP